MINRLILSLKGIGFNTGGRDILKDVSLDFFQGITFLFGNNGSGKTTLLDRIAGLRSGAGSIHLDNQDLDSLKPKDRAKQIAFIPQRSQWEQEISIHEFMMMGRFPFLDSWKGYGKEDAEIVDKWIRVLGMDEFRDRSVSTLSGGEFQKIRIGRGLVQEAPVLILDEPTQNLDPLGREMVFGLLNELGNSGKLIICATHDREAAEMPGAKVLGIRQGRIVLQRESGAGTWEELRTSVFHPRT